MIPRNDTQYAQMTSKYVLKPSAFLDEQTKQSHKLYNRALYDLRQGFFHHQKWVWARSTGAIYHHLNQLFKKRYESRDNMLYRSFLSVQTAQQTLKEVAAIWYAWQQARRAYEAAPQKFTGRPRLPKYLHKAQRHVVHFSNQTATIKNGYLVINTIINHHRVPLLKVKLQAGIEKIGTITVKPEGRHYLLCVPNQTDVKTISYLPDNHRYLGVDPGLDNTFTCTINTNHFPLIINGKPVKSINRYYNKRLAALKKDQARCHNGEKMIITKQGQKSVYPQTKQMRQITAWRNTKIMEFAHKASKRIIDYALNCGVNTIVIGKNQGQKRSSNMGKRNNQNFVGIPHAKMINLIKYKANLQGLTVICTNESYTSQTSFLDHEKPCWANGNKSRRRQGLTPINRRIHRGLFKSNHGYLINADVNGSLQIIKKVFPNISFDNGIVDVVLHPVKETILI